MVDRADTPVDNTSTGNPLVTDAKVSRCVMFETPISTIEASPSADEYSQGQQVYPGPRAGSLFENAAASGEMNNER